MPSIVKIRNHHYNIISHNLQETNENKEAKQIVHKNLSSLHHQLLQLNTMLVQLITMLILQKPNSGSGYEN
jgi:hypothetical protein